MGRLPCSHTGTGCRVLVSVLIIVCLVLPITGADFITPRTSAQDSKALFFGPNDHGLGTGDESALSDYLTLLKNNPDLVIVIDGYSDITGEEQYNLNLSRMRADTVKKFFLSRGIPAGRIKARGNGKTDKFDSGVDDESLRMNRRVVLTLESAPGRKTAAADPAPSPEAAKTPEATPLPETHEEVIEEGAAIEDAPQAAPSEMPSEPAPSGKPAPPRGLEAAIRRSMKNVAPGRVVFDVPQVMNMGETYDVEVDLSYSFLKGLSESLHGMSGEGFDNVKIGQNVGLSLNGRGFDIRPVTDGGGAEEVFPAEDTGITKLVTENSNPRWVWKVKPVASGYRSLKLSIEIIAEDAEYNETVNNYPLFQKVVEVKPNFIYMLSRSYWIMVIFIIVVVAVVGWILIKKIRLG
ncbi:MAG TPA: OmpA family protein [Thermodesulfobacteriota bacterium]|nr:OmpA family protein [Thermodesulfobacteriota bacterium]